MKPDNNDSLIPSMPAQGTDEAEETLPPYTGPGELYDPRDFGGAD